MNCWRRIARKRRPDRPPPNVNCCLLFTCLTPAEKPAGVRFFLNYNGLLLRSKSFSQVKPHSGRTWPVWRSWPPKEGISYLCGAKNVFFSQQSVRIEGLGAETPKKAAIADVFDSTIMTVTCVDLGVMHVLWRTCRSQPRFWDGLGTQRRRANCIGCKSIEP